MCARQHRYVRHVARHGVEQADHLPQLWQQYIVPPVTQHQRIGNIVDVLRGAGEMRKRSDPGQFGILTEAFANEILDRLDVVIGPTLDFA